MHVQHSDATLETLTADMEALDAELAALIKKPKLVTLLKLLGKAQAKLEELDAAGQQQQLLERYEALGAEALATGQRFAELVVVRCLLTVLTQIAVDVESSARAANHDAKDKMYTEQARLIQAGLEADAARGIYERYEQQYAQLVAPYDFYGLPEPEVLMRYAQPDDTQPVKLKSFSSIKLV